MNVRRILSTALLAAAFTATAAVPAKAQMALYVLGTGSRVSGINVGYNTPQGSFGNFTGYGAGGGFYTDWAHFGPLTTGADFRFSYGLTPNPSSHNSSVRDGSVMARGVLPLGRVQPYVQFGATMVNTNYGDFPGTSDGAGIGYAAGVDFGLMKHLALRLDYDGATIFEVSSQAGTGNLNLNTYSAGFVFVFNGVVTTSGKHGGGKKGGK